MMQPRAAIRLICLLALVLPARPGGARATRSSLHAAMVWEQGWPMVGHDPRRTGRSPDTGPRSPRLRWSYPGIDGPVVIGPDGGVYGWTARGLIALSATGRRRWIVAAQEGEGGPPALGPDGLLRVGGDLSWAPGTRSTGMPHILLLAVSSRGQRRWTIRALPWATVPQSVPFSKGTAPIVTASNVLYMPFVGPAYSAGQNNGVEVVSPSGTPLRRLLAGRGGSIAVAPGGAVYELGYDYAGGTALLAAGPGGALLWTRTVTYDQDGGVLVGRNGRVYASDGAGWGSGDGGEVAAYTQAGRLLWRIATRGVAAIAERGDGVVLVADRSGLAAMGPGGVRLWRVPFGRLPENAATFASPAVDATGRAYAGSADGEVRAVATDGRVLWTLRAGGPSPVGTAPTVAIGPDDLAVVGTDGVLRIYR